MNRAELQAVMDQPGFGTGRAFRDRKAQEAEALALLPDPKDVMPVRATTDAGVGWLVCSTGNSGDDGQDWHVVTDEVRASQLSGDVTFPVDAKIDALVIAALVNAWRMGLIVKAST